MHTWQYRLVCYWNKRVTPSKSLS